MEGALAKSRSLVNFEEVGRVAHAFVVYHYVEGGTSTGSIRLDCLAHYSTVALSVVGISLLTSSTGITAAFTIVDSVSEASTAVGSSVVLLSSTSLTG